MHLRKQRALVLLAHYTRALCAKCVRYLAFYTFDKYISINATKGSTCF
jgi:hypothetical protein